MADDLPPDLAEMLLQRYGGSFLKDIGRPRGLTAERVRQILAKVDPDHSARAREARRQRALASDGL